MAAAAPAAAATCGSTTVAAAASARAAARRTARPRARRGVRRRGGRHDGRSRYGAAVDRAPHAGAGVAAGRRPLRGRVGVAPTRARPADAAVVFGAPRLRLRGAGASGRLGGGSRPRRAVAASRVAGGRPAAPARRRSRRRSASTAAPSAPAARGVRLASSIARAQPGEPAGQRRQEDRPADRHGRRIELLPQRAARPEEQHLDRGDGRAGLVGDLGVGEADDLAEHEDAALLRAGEPRAPRRAPGTARTAARRRAGSRRRRRAVLARTALSRPEAAAAHVLGDREQPGPRRLGPRPAQHRAVGVRERRLRHVLGVVGVAELAQGRPIDVGAMPPVELLEGEIYGGASGAGSTRGHLQHNGRSAGKDARQRSARCFAARSQRRRIRPLKGLTTSQ